MALQMTWQPTSLHLLHDRLKTIGAASAPSPPLGLKNLGNTCYLNSVLQCLTYTPPLANFCLNNQHTSLCDRNPNPKNNNCPFCILERRIVRSLTLDATLDAPSKIHSCLTIFADHFRYGRQEDAHEFLRYVIDACHNTCLRLKKLHYTTANGTATATATGAGGDSTIVKEIFGGALRSQVKCLSCGADSNKTDEIMDINLDLFHSTSLKDAMDRFFDAEVLDGANKYKCEKCKKLVVARKQMSILKAPNILVIQLKRFEGMHGGKIDRAVSFEEVLLLSGYMCKESQDPHPEYNLFGTIVHSGYSPESGHYYAYIKDAIGRWYCCNDSHVSLSTLHEVLSEKVYILFFSRSNERSRPTKAASCANGVKSIHHNGNDGAPTSEAVMPLKSVARRPSEAHTEKVIPSISRNGKVPSSPLIKFGLVKTLDSKRVYGNGNGNGNGHALTNGHVKKHFDKNESSDMEKNRNKKALVASNNVANGYTSHDSGEQRSKQKVLSHANGEIHSVVKLNTMEKEVFANNGLGSSSIVKGIETDPVSNGRQEKYISGCKRKTLEQEPNNVLQDEHQMVFEKSKEMIMKDASSSLRSSGWYEDVYCFMRAKKRLRAQATGNTTSEIELKKKMIEEAKQAFSSQIPQSLKAHLIGSLRSLFQP